MGKSEVLQYSSNVKHNLAAPGVFAKIVKFASYSPSATFWICLSSLEPSLRIQNSRPTWPCLIIEVLPDQAKFLQLSGYYTVMNSTLTFHTTHFWLLLPHHGCTVLIDIWPFGRRQCPVSYGLINTFHENSEAKLGVINMFINLLG